MSYTQPLCADCWDREHPDRPASRAVTAYRETCCMCGAETYNGIFIRRDPATVPYPSED